MSDLSVYILSSLSEDETSELSSSDEDDDDSEADDKGRTCDEIHSPTAVPCRAEKPQLVVHVQSWWHDSERGGELTSNVQGIRQVGPLVQRLGDAADGTFKK